MILDSFRQDVRVGLRVLFKEKSFCFLAVFVLALGIGGATTQFTVVNAIVLRGFSFPHPEQLVSVGLIDPKATDQVNNFGIGQIPTAQDYEDLKAAQRSFALMAGYLSGSTINVTYKNNPQRYTGGYVTEDFFKIIGVSPVMGRDFTAEDNKPGAEKVAILGDEIWRRDFASDPNIVGQSVRINGKAATIIGVMPPNFKFPFTEELWTPLYNEFPPAPRGDLRLGANNNAPAVMGRLKPGVTLDQVNAEFVALARHLAEDNPKTNQNFTSASVQPLLNAFTGVQLRQIVWAMLAAVILVLMIACVNVMNMQFGRAALRAKELAIRGALGATRWRLVRQMLTESLVVAVFGAVAGIVLAYWGVDMLVRAFSASPFPLPYWMQFIIDGRVLTFTVAVTLIATLVSGFVPAYLSSRGNAAEIMKEGGRGNTNRLANMITRILVVGQIALTAALLIAATLQIKSIRNQTKLDYGYDENAVYSARMALMEGAYPNEDARRQFFVHAVRALRANPQFDAAAMSDRFRMTFAPQGQYEVDGQNYLTDRDRPRGNFESVSDNYFSTLGLKILEGRDFTVDDNDAKQPVAIVNTSFARKYWGNQSAIGHQVRIFNPGQPQQWRTIVGVVPDMLMQGPFDQQTESAGFYMPLLGASPATQFCTIIVRPRGGQRAETLGPSLSRAVSELDSNLPTYFPGTPARLHNEILNGPRIVASLFSIFGVVAFVLSAVGLYGVMSFSVNQRTQEFGIRMALGADATRIFRMVMTQGAWQLMIGLVLGAGGIALLFGVVMAAALKNILFKVNTLDPTIYFAVAGMLTLVAAISCFVPARRATRVDPMVALRYE
ncbi:MAG TPA: ABC transporter permease [Chthoniobacterales bacterium]|jgi:putative ABC transport system permease protein|nr:ABC transporter permease [Chthoniobacterales bacterium]